MDVTPAPVLNLIDEFSRLPRIGPKTASRLTFYLLRPNPEQALAHTAKYFGTLPKPERKLNTTYTEEPPQDGERIVTGSVAKDDCTLKNEPDAPTGSLAMLAPLPWRTRCGPR